MFKCRAVVITFLMQCHIITCSKLVSLQSELKALEGSTVSLKWEVQSDLQNALKSVSCSYDKLSSPEIIEGKAVGDSSFNFSITTEGENIYGKRISVDILKSNSTSLLTIFDVKIRQVTVADESVYVCYYGEHESTIRLDITSPLIINSPGFPTEVTVKRNNITYVQVELCARPDPIIEWTYGFKTSTTRGIEMKNSASCYLHRYPLQIDNQSDCRNVLKYRVTHFKREIKGNINIKVNLNSEKPTQVQITSLDSDCSVLTWIGPNIGTCEAKLLYEIAFIKNKKRTKTMKSSSNTLKFCSHDAETDNYAYDVKVRTWLNNKTSEWSKKAVFVLHLWKDANLVKRDAVIIVTILAILLVLGLIIVILRFLKKKQKKRRTKLDKNETTNPGTLDQSDGYVMRYSSLDKLNDASTGSVFYSEAKELEEVQKNKKATKNRSRYTSLEDTDDASINEDNDVNETQNFYTKPKDLEPGIDNVNRLTQTSQLEDYQDMNSINYAENTQNNKTQEIYENLGRKVKKSISLDDYDVTDVHRANSIGIDGQIYDLIPHKTNKAATVDNKKHRQQGEYEDMDRSYSYDSATPNKIHNTKALWGITPTVTKRPSVSNQQLKYSSDEGEENVYAVPTMYIDTNEQMKSKEKIYENVS